VDAIDTERVRRYGFFFEMRPNRQKISSKCIPSAEQHKQQPSKQQRDKDRSLLVTTPRVPAGYGLRSSLGAARAKAPSEGARDVAPCRLHSALAPQDCAAQQDGRLRLPRYVPPEQQATKHACGNHYVEIPAVQSQQQSPSVGNAKKKKVHIYAYTS
jgi:hypothetical protein